MPAPAHSISGRCCTQIHLHHLTSPRAAGCASAGLLWSTLVSQHAIPVLQMSLVVADTGEIESIRKFRPVDCTTNPSLVLKAVQNPQYAHYLPKAIDAEDGPISNSERCARACACMRPAPKQQLLQQNGGLGAAHLKACAVLVIWWRQSPSTWGPIASVLWWPHAVHPLSHPVARTLAAADLSAASC